MKKTIFITGTDTGVGKTLVTALLALRFRSLGFDVGVMKPIASGCQWRDGELVNEDAEFLRTVTSVADDPSLINPIRYEEPLAPLVAARRAALSTNEVLSQVGTALEELKARHDLVLVEGVGGLLVPIAEVAASDQGKSTIKTCVDLAQLVNGENIIVARRNLGTINHTLLTVDQMRSSGLGIAGLIFSDAMPIEHNDVAANTSPQVIAELTGAPLWGCVPTLINTTAASLKLAADAYLNDIDISTL
jgi:dethiobiotin synthetase